MAGTAEGRAASARPLTIELADGDPAWGRADALLQAGFLLETRPGASAREFMREAIGLEEDYIEGVVSTVFIDAEPVDDIDAATLRPDSLIALSAAMPGLAGAVMRRKSPYASFREAISYAARAGAGPREEAASGAGMRAGGSSSDARTAGTTALVRVKLFNSVMRDRGRATLARGVLAEPGSAAGICAGQPGAAAAVLAAAAAGNLLRLRVLAAAGGRR
ncbi:MAG TPA: hypothetical protein PLB91_13285 [Spirochaetales bacterium]|nr:hypothetical protein [Spirochaetales bacterium]HRY56176.1 hypothetical protein [Spirochaetia bacterium]HRZ66071.1 hypothetical protein [Spirochaetia bacterium]